jgi:hypothetical protein
MSTMSGLGGYIASGLLLTTFWTNDLRRLTLFVCDYSAACDSALGAAQTLTRNRQLSTDSNVCQGPPALHRRQQIAPDWRSQKGERNPDTDHQSHQRRVEAVLYRYDRTADLRAHRRLKQGNLDHAAGRTEHPDIERVARPSPTRSRTSTGKKLGTAKGNRALRTSRLTLRTSLRPSTSPTTAAGITAGASSFRSQAIRGSGDAEPRFLLIARSVPSARLMCSVFCRWSA